jgi:cystathionine beta-lyase
MTDFNEFIDRRGTDSIKWNYFSSDVLPLWVADTDFRSPPQVMDALTARINHGIFGYGSIQKKSKLAIQSWLSSRHNWKVSPDDIVLLPGVVFGFNLAARVLCHPGDSYLIQTPAYHPFFDVSRNNHLELSIAPLSASPSGFFEIDWGSFTAAILPSTRLFILCNPHNPTGRVFSLHELQQIAEICLDHKLLICADEIHSDLVYPGFRHIPIASLSEEIAQSTITLISASKTFNLAGLQSSAAVITNPQLRSIFKKGLEAVEVSVNLLGECAMTAAYQHGADWLDDLLTYLTKNRQILLDYVSKQLPGISISPPQGTFLGWLDCSGTGLDNPAEFFLAKAKVALNSGTWFGDRYTRFTRINFACPTQTLLQALESIKLSLGEI